MLSRVLLIFISPIRKRMATHQPDRPCPPGTIRRAAYVRHLSSRGHTIRRKGKLTVTHPKVRATRVRAACIRERGKGRTARNKIGPLKKGELIKYGYSYRLSDKLRHEALKRAVKAYGALETYHKLDAVAKLSKRVAPDASAIFALDRDWVRERLNNVH